MLAGLMLARAGVDTLVLEKHADFLRDFRGDTLHPSTLEVMAELGLLERLLDLPHDRVPQIEAQFGEHSLKVADFRHLPVRCGFIAMMPQWDFLSFLAREAARSPHFELRMRAEVDGLLFQGDRVAGVRVGTEEIPTQLVIGADGRHSSVRRLAGLEVEALGAPIDVLWFRLARKAGDPATSMGRFDAGVALVLINRREYWQCGYVIPKGAAEKVRAAGLAAFRATLGRLLPWSVDRVGELADWEQVKLLTVQIDRLRRWWRPGLLCIGDAAHAMSPVGGVGINIAVQDAVAAANLLRFRPPAKRCPAAPRMADEGHPAPADPGSGPADHGGTGKPATHRAAKIFSVGDTLSAARPHPRPAHRHGCSTGARGPAALDAGAFR